MRAKISSLRDDPRGFTLVELLAVMLILSVLAGLAIPMFFAQGGKARDTVAKEAVDTAQTTIELIGRDRGGYSGITAEDLREEEPTLTTAALNEPVTTGTTYTIQVFSGTGGAFSVSRVEGGSLDYDCAPRDTGGCPLDGDWSE